MAGSQKADDGVPGTSQPRAGPTTPATSVDQGAHGGNPEHSTEVVAPPPQRQPTGGSGEGRNTAAAVNFNAASSAAMVPPPRMTTDSDQPATGQEEEFLVVDAPQNTKQEARRKRKALMEEKRQKHKQEPGPQKRLCLGNPTAAQALSSVSAAPSSDTFWPPLPQFQPRRVSSSTCPVCRIRPKAMSQSPIQHRCLCQQCYSVTGDDPITNLCPVCCVHRRAPGQGAAAPAPRSSAQANEGMCLSCLFCTADEELSPFKHLCLCGVCSALTGDNPDTACPLCRAHRRRRGGGGV